MLNVKSGAIPEFGFSARVPLVNGKVDRTEVDMRLGDLLIEAKLTESDFQRARKPTMGLYRNFREVLSYEELPHNTHACLSYQLLRNVLAAYATHCAFCVLYGCAETSAN
jgi:hypothetical protein